MNKRSKYKDNRMPMTMTAGFKLGEMPINNDFVLVLHFLCLKLEHEFDIDKI